LSLTQKLGKKCRFSKVSLMQASMIDLETILPTVQAALADHLYDQEKEMLHALEPQQFMQRPFSAVGFLRARTSNGIRKVVMKTTVHHPVNRAITERENQAVVEYNILKLMHPKFETVAGCSVPRPLLVLPEIETYVMEFVEGQLLMDEFKFTRILSAKNRFLILREHINYCGRWLKHFQEFTGNHTADVGVLNGVIERAEHRLKLIEGSGDPRCPKNLRNKVIKFLNEQLERLRGKDILVSGRHGDFTPLNVIAGSEGITVIDFLGYQVEPVPVDIFKMLVFLKDEMMALSSSRSRVNELKRAFLDGYGAFPHVLEPVLLICEAMQRIVSIWGAVSNPNLHFHHRIEASHRIKEHINWLTTTKKRKMLWNFS